MNANEAPALEKRGSPLNLTLATLAFAFCFSAWGMIAPIAPKLQDKLGLSNTQTAIMIALPVVLGSILRLPFGVMTDRFGGRMMFSGLLAYSAGAALLIGFSTSYAMLLIAGLLLGAAGASFAIGVPFVASWYPKERHGFALGVYGMGNVGTAASAFLVPYMYVHHSQLSAALVLAVGIAIFTLVWLAFARNAPASEVVQTAKYRDVLRYGLPMWRLALFYFVTFGGFVAMAIFLPKLLRDWFDFSLASAGLRAAGFTLAATLARPIGGWASDRFTGEKVLVVAFIGIGIDAIGLAWQASDPSLVPVRFFCLTMAVFLGLGNGAVFKLVPQMFPDATGAVTGIVGAAGGLGGFFPPLLMGIVKDATGAYVMGFVFLVAFAWVCAGQALALAESRRQNPGRPGGDPPDLPAST